MVTLFQGDLKKFSRHLVQIHRAPAMVSVFGFVVDSSDEWVLLHSFNSEAFCLDGYDVIRQRDIQGHFFFDDSRYWRYRAIRRLGIRQSPPRGIRLASAHDLLSSVAERYPLLSVHREVSRRPTTYVGPILSMGERSLRMKDVDCFGKWTGPRRLRYVDITRICFDGGYLKASAMTAQGIRRRAAREAFLDMV